MLTADGRSGCVPTVLLVAWISYGCQLATEGLEVNTSSSRIITNTGCQGHSTQCSQRDKCENYAVVPLFFLNFFLFIARPPVLGTTLNCIIMPHDYYDNTWHVPMVKIPCIGYNSWTWSINFKALRCQLTTMGDSGYRQHRMSTLSQRTSSITNTLLP